jgi:hypothetical protein
MPSQPRRLTGQEWDAINAAEATVRAEKLLGHTWKLIHQTELAEVAAVPPDKWWGSCTCGRWMAGRWYPSRAEALVAFQAHKQEPGR